MAANVFSADKVAGAYTWAGNETHHTMSDGKVRVTEGVGRVKPIGTSGYSSQYYTGVNGDRMRIVYDDAGNYTISNYDSGSTTGYDVGSGLMYDAGNSGNTYALSNTKTGDVTVSHNGMTETGNINDGGGLADFFKAGPGGSTFANTAQGLGSLAGMYFGYQGLGLAKKADSRDAEKHALFVDQYNRSKKNDANFAAGMAAALTNNQNKGL